MKKRKMKPETMVRLFSAALIGTNILLALGVGILAWQILR